MYGFRLQKRKFWHLIKFGESFSLGSLLNQSQTYQGNPCGVYLDLSSFTRSGVIQTFVACIKQSAPTQVHIKRPYKDQASRNIPSALPESFQRPYGPQWV